ncbi:hypothetical protein LGQ02_15650 [Bacillus shivajii]|uniref:sporulation membrane protein YtrI n=1 Tax=Bacillus shivajii TaxID=1983719 RepID=UPI001CF951E3|nr:sporulation membrane protein YtrI [Bacillus shivajii]UCZ52266.1 hypothetical protein LGQ02_15650 [Bacillus shivajii]
MRIPPFYHEPSWQRFFAGIILGMLVGWLFFLYQFGNVHEKLVLKINDQQKEIDSQAKTIDILRKDQDERNEENQKKLTVQDIKLHFVNEDDIKLSELTLHELRSAVESELDIVRNKNIETVHNSREFLEKTVENKIYTIKGTDKRYQLKIEYLVLYTTVDIYLRIEPGE